jgi:elongation factor P
MAAITTADFKNGICIKFNNDLMKMVEFQHVKPGKGAAFVRTKLKSMTNGRVLENTFPSGSRLETVRIEIREYQFLYGDDVGYNFMNSENYDQIIIQEKIINAPELLMEGQICEIMFHAEEELPLSCDLPQFVEMMVTYCEPGFKGDTASSNVTKNATVETGANIAVPLFVNQGDKIKIDTRTKSYMERVK